MMMRSVFFALFTFALPQILTAGQAPAQMKTVWSGIYTAEQATRGEESYKMRCARCHGAKLEGTQGNGLVGRDFMDRWREDSMGSLFEFISEGMPPARRGEGRPLISVPTYLDIIAFILSKNDFPAGPDPLMSEGLDGIQIQNKEGPGPVPHGSLVRIAGCLTGAGDAWSITNAQDPVRTRTPKTTDYQEFKAAESAPAGTQTFRLANLGFLASTFKPETLKGSRLLVKGTLVRQADSLMRVSIVGFRKIADTCP